MPPPACTASGCPAGRPEALAFFQSFFPLTFNLSGGDPVIENNNARGLVFNIQKYSVHDGPGIRTIVFTKGCGLRCRWCSNPESQHREPELAYNQGRCLGTDKCTRCFKACPNGALSHREDGFVAIDRSKCVGCKDMPCAEACPSQGIIVYGKPYTVTEALKVAQEDAMFYARSGGGMTISGGEPLLQSEFALNLLRLARERRVKTCIETCGLVPTDVVREAAQYLNYVLFDIKHMDPEVHKKHTGMPNDLILKNFQTLVTEFPDLPITARTPVIPGFNDHGPDIKAICDFLKPFEHVKYEMLPYHRLGTQKYTFLDRVPPMGDVTLDDKKFAALQKIAVATLGDRVVIPR